MSETVQHFDPPVIVTVQRREWHTVNIHGVTCITENDNGVAFFREANFDVFPWRGSIDRYMVEVIT